VRLKPEYVPTMRPGAESGLGAWEDGAIAMLGDDADALACPDFRVVREPATTMDRSFPYYLKYWLTPRPVIAAASCRACGVCSEVCPLEPKAVRPPGDDPGRVPVYDYRRCIRCYCCQEMCPHGAISVRRPLLSRLIHR
jgi:ferredoxin